MSANDRAAWWEKVAATRLELPRPVRRWVSSLLRALDAPPADLVAVEWGDESIRAVRLTRTARGSVRAVHAQRPLTMAHVPAARVAIEREALQQIVEVLGANGRPVVATLPGGDVVVRRLTLPRLNAADLRSAIELECRKHVPYPVSEAEIRYEVLEAEAGASEVPVVVAIAPKHRVEERRALLAVSGLRPWALTVSAVGLRSYLDALGLLSADELVAYVEVGRAQSQIVVSRGRDLRFSRDLGFGLETMAGSLRQIVVPGLGTVERTAEEAMQLLRSRGIPQGAEEAQFVDNIPLAAVAVMLRPSLERLVRELWNSIDYCHEQFLGEAVSRVVLLGEGATLPNLDHYLAGVLKMPVVAADAGSAAVGVDAATGATASIPISSLALASAERRTLNFLENAGGDRWARVVEGIPAQATAAAATILVVSLALPVEFQVAAQRQRAETLRGELERLSTQSAAVARFRSARAEETRLRALLARLTGSQVLWSSVLRDLSHRVAADVRLTAMELIEPPANPAPSASGTTPPPPPRSLRFSGLLRTANEPPEQVLASLLRSLASSPAYDQVRLDGCERVAPGLSTFTVTAVLAEGAGP